MNYLIDLGFDKETIELLKSTLPENTLKTFEKEQENITNNNIFCVFFTIVKH